MSTGWGGNASSLSIVVGAGILDFVLRVFLRCASMCPMVVASNDGGNLLIAASVSPMNGGRNPLASAVFSVERAGEKRVACAKVTRSA